MKNKTDLQHPYDNGFAYTDEDVHWSRSDDSDNNSSGTLEQD
jgi:hypothetical protein